MDETPDLSGFLMAHRAMRQEFGLLAETGRLPLDGRRAQLWDEQVAMVLETLHHHHTAEDDTIWPWLRDRVPAAVADLDLLEAEHEQIDPVIRTAGDESLPRPVRAEALQRLHELVNAHLDREERVAVPLIPQHVTVPEWDALGERMLAETSRRRLPLVFGWMASASDEAQRRAALQGVPLMARVLFRRVWWPSYRRRITALYGTDVAAPLLAA